MTKAERIRALLAEGYKSSWIAHAVGTSVKYVCVVRWRGKNPGYQKQWMADSRSRKAERAAAPVETEAVA